MTVSERSSKIHGHLRHLHSNAGAIVFYVLLTLLIIDAFLLMTIVLLQAGKGGGLAAVGGMSSGADTLFGGRQAATLLTKATWWTGGIFLVLSLTLSMMSTRTATPDPILRGEFGAPGAGVTVPAEPTAPAGGMLTPPGAPDPAAEPRPEEVTPPPPPGQ